MAGEDQQDQNVSEEELERVNKFFDDRIKTGIENYLREHRTQQPQQAAQAEQQQNRQQSQSDDLLQPYIQPHLNELKLESEATKDYVRFYKVNPDATEHEETIEKVFEAMMQAGRGIRRQDIFDSLIGKEYRADPDKFVAKLDERRKKELERAEAALDVGSFSMTKVKNDPNFSNLDSKTADEMAELMDGVSF